MTVSLTTNQTTYKPRPSRPHDAYHDKFLQSEYETVALGPSIDGFFVMQNAKVIWRSDSGVEPQYIVRRILRTGPIHYSDCAMDDPCFG